MIPSGVDVRRFSRLGDRGAAKAAFGLDPAAPVAGWVGRHFAQKRPADVVRAARRIVSEVPGAQFLMAGDGPLIEQTRAAAAGHPAIHLLGHRPDVEQVYAALDVMLLASAWEGLPRTVLEAQAAGIPVVATDVSGVGEVVVHGETGYLAPPGAWPELAERAIELLRDAARLEAMGRAARRRVGESYSAAHTARATAELYDAILSGRRSRRRRR